MGSVSQFLLCSCVPSSVIYPLILCSTSALSESVFACWKCLSTHSLSPLGNLLFVGAGVGVGVGDGVGRWCWCCWWG